VVDVPRESRRAPGEAEPRGGAGSRRARVEAVRSMIVRAARSRTPPATHLPPLEVSTGRTGFGWSWFRAETKCFRWENVYTYRLLLLFGLRLRHEAVYVRSKCNHEAVVLDRWYLRNMWYRSLEAWQYTEDVGAAKFDPYPPLWDSD